jgi:hypothetical protein
MVVSLDYAQVGMRVTVTDTKGNLIKQKRNFQTKTVYKELMVDNQKINADEYCAGGYFLSRKNYSFRRNADV